MYTLYSMQRSGNSYKARLALGQLRIHYRLIEVDILKGESHTPEFLAKNPNGQVPLLEVAPGRYLAESNAILWYLAEGSAFLPSERLLRAQVLQWMFFEQSSHEPFVATARFIVRHLPLDSPRRAELPMRLEQGRFALKVMETQLQRRPFFVGGHYSIADIALYAYTHVAHEA